jgi:hypothetical protein
MVFPIIAIFSLRKTFTVQYAYLQISFGATLKKALFFRKSVCKYIFANNDS